MTDSSSTTTYTASFTYLKLSSCEVGASSGSGGAFYIESTYLTSLTFTYPTFTSVVATLGKGGVFYIANMGGTLTIKDATVTTLSAT